jgi:hypothetical protein
MNTQRDPEPLDEAIDVLRTMRVPDRPKHADAELLARLAAGLLPTTSSVSQSRRRILMRVTKWSLAVSVLAIAVGMLFLGSSSTPALADVLKAAEKHKLVKYKLTQGCETKDGTSVIPSVDTAYADLRAPRFRRVGSSPGMHKGGLDFESVFVTDWSKDVTMHMITEVITEKGKTDPEVIAYLKMFERIGVPRKEVTLNTAHGDDTSATSRQYKSMLENLRELETHKDVVTTKSKLNGKDVLKYRIEEDNKTTILTVDAMTKLPVKLEEECTDPKKLHPTISKSLYELSDFEWDPELKGFKNLDEMFSTTPPKEGYKVEDKRKKVDEKKEK